jgi:hypothetical protein
MKSSGDKQKSDRSGRKSVFCKGALAKLETALAAISDRTKIP